jgi:amino acid transporter
LWLVNQLELLTAIVSFGALLSFALLHLSVIAEFFWRRKSRNWFRHLVSPAIGFIIIGYVLWNTESRAKLVGLCWMACGLVVVLAARSKSSAAARAQK